MSVQNPSNQTHQCHHSAQEVQKNDQTSSRSTDNDAVREAMQQWIYSLIIAGFKGLGKATEDSDSKGGQNVSDAGPVSMDTLNAMAGGAIASADATLAEGSDILSQLFSSTYGQELNADTSIYFDEGMQDPDLVALFGGELPIAGPQPQNPSAGASADRGEPDAVIGSTSNAATTDEAGETDEPPPVITTGDYSPTFGVDGGGEDISIYGLAALVLLTTMENKRSIVANRLDQIESTNNRVQGITNTIAYLKAAKTGLEKDSAKTNVNVKALQTVANNNLGPTGELDEEGTQKFFNDLKLSGDDVDKITNAGPGSEQEIELSKAQIDAVIEKLTSQSEALSTQNQTRNIKLQQQISELQVTTQMTSAIIDQIKTLGSGIAQRI